MTVRAKFKVQSLTDAGDGMKSIVLQPVIGDNPENKEFFKWTPSGQISLGVLNPSAAEQFEIGKEFYVDFTPAPASAT